MTLSIYNTLTRKKEKFVPLEPGKVKMYVCGPTVYNYMHIGNARPLIVFDVVRKYLQAIGYDVHFVVNFTDVDDKLIRKAEETGLSVGELADKFIAAFYEDAQGLGVAKATVHPRVTENIPEIVAFVQGLVDKGFAYGKEGDVFFRTAKFPAYGRLSHQDLDELQLGIRIEVDEKKDDPRDFVLWKKAKPGEIKWDSPWGEGRPGWHIECSAMARKYLGETIDIHGGGQDLQFPHHECELAQSEALSGQTFVKYWMHNGYININNEKMSKSLKNGIDVKALRALYTTQALRYFVLSAHYRSPLNFSDEVMRQAEQSVARIGNCLTNLRYRLDGLADAAQAQSAAPADGAFRKRVDAIMAQFHEKMQDDFNTPDAITALFDLVAETNQYLQQDDVSATALRHADESFRQMDAVLGILPHQNDAGLDEEIERLIKERAAARKAKNFARSDEIRDQLLTIGVILEDTPQGTRWRRKS
ncbi:MAG TPA: cysteine--tRNA ligase [Bacilli bacterium]